jgi:hypothetical protein
LHAWLQQHWLLRRLRLRCLLLYIPHPTAISCGKARWMQLADNTATWHLPHDIAAAAAAANTTLAAAAARFIWHCWLQACRQRSQLFCCVGEEAHRPAAANAFLTHAGPVAVGM